MDEMIVKRVLPLKFDVIGYPSCQCTGGGTVRYSSTRPRVGKAVLYIRTRVSDSNKIYKSRPRDQDERTSDARAGEIVTSHKLQILCENEPRGALDGHPVAYGFLHKGWPNIPSSSACHAHAGSIGTK